MNKATEYIIGFSALIIYALGLAGTWGKLKQKTDEQDEEIKNLSRSIYGKNHLPIFVPQEYCDKNRSECMRVTCAKMDELKSILREQSKKMDEVTQFMGRVEEFMRRGDGGVQ